MLIDSVDMNLLRPLRALLEERSVSRAAARLGVSQPTVSVALNRLRRHFDDQLLVRDGVGYRLTPLAVRLQDSVIAALRASNKVFSAQSSFDPGTSHREFVVYSTDFATAAVGAPLVRSLEKSAPHVTVRFDHIGVEVVNAGLASLRECDGIFLPYGYLDDAPCIDVVIDRWACLLAADNDAVSADPSSSELLSLQWVSTLDGKQAATPAGMQLQISGKAPVISVVTPNFFAVPWLLVGTTRVALVQRRFAEWAVSAVPGLRMVDPPFDLEGIREAFWWHPDRQNEPEHEWFREQIRAVSEATVAGGMEYYEIE